jgi:hypothetical protein
MPRRDRRHRAEPRVGAVDDDRRRLAHPSRRGIEGPGDAQRHAGGEGGAAHLLDGGEELLRVEVERCAHREREVGRSHHDCVDAAHRCELAARSTPSLAFNLEPNRGARRTPAAPAPSQGQAPRAPAASAAGRMHGLRDRGRCGHWVADAGEDDAVGARVEHRRHQAVRFYGQARERVCAGRLRAEDHLLRLERSERTVLEVDPDQIEGFGEELGRRRSRQRQNRSGQARARA